MKYRAHFLVKHVSPEDISVLPDNAERAMASNSTATFAVFDKGARTVVSALPTSAVISVGNAGLFAVGQKVQVIKDDNVELIANVDAVDVTAGTITLDSIPSPQLTVESPVRRIYGPTGAQRQTMALGGDSRQRVGEEDWWWQAVGDPDDFSDLVPGVEVEVESIAVKTAGTGVNSIQSKCELVEADCA